MNQFVRLIEKALRNPHLGDRTETALKALRTIRGILRHDVGWLSPEYCSPGYYVAKMGSELWSLEKTDTDEESVTWLRWDSEEGDGGDWVKDVPRCKLLLI